MGAKIAYKPAQITFPSGAIIRTGHLKDDQAYTKYQGQEYQRILIEELTQIPEEKRYLQLIASCRTTIPEIKTQVFATTNPGGVGHGWVKSRFIDPSPPNIPFIDKTSGRGRIYIPATVDDNPTLVQNDPAYVGFLDSLKDTDTELWKAWRLGDWDTFAGQFFREFKRSSHVVLPFIPDKTTSVIVGGMDWGYNAPFSFHLAQVKPVYLTGGEKFFRTTTFFEVYGTGKTPAEWNEQIQKVLQRFKVRLTDISFIKADPAMFNKGTDGSMSIRDQFYKEDNDWRILQPGSNDRIPGWAQMHTWLAIAPDGDPYWQITDNCTELIRTLPALVHDELKVEDVDTTGEDHAPDDQRYMLKALKHLEGRTGQIKSKRERYDPTGNRGKFFGSNENMEHHMIDPTKFR